MEQKQLRIYANYRNKNEHIQKNNNNEKKQNTIGVFLYTAIVYISICFPHT